MEVATSIMIEDFYSSLYAQWCYQFFYIIHVESDDIILKIQLANISLATHNIMLSWITGCLALITRNGELRNSFIPGRTVSYPHPKLLL